MSWVQINSRKQEEHFLEVVISCVKLARLRRIQEGGPCLGETLDIDLSKIFCLQYKSGVHSNSMVFTIHLFCHARLAHSYLRGILSKQWERERIVSVVCLPFCCLPQSGIEAWTSWYTVDVRSRCAMKAVHFKSGLKPEVKISVLWLSASPLGNVLIFLLSGLTWMMEKGRLSSLSLWSLPVCVVPC